MSKLKQKRAESPISLQPRATPWVYSIQLTTRPVRATICGTIELPLQGAWFVFVRYPGRSCLGKRQSRAALGYGEIGLSARIICILTHPQCSTAHSDGVQQGCQVRQVEG